MRGATLPFEMTASSDSRPLPPTMDGLRPDRGSDPPMDGLAGQRIFKKHKVLPHPRKERLPCKSDVPPAGLGGYGLVIDIQSRGSGSQPSSPTLRHQLRRIGTGPDPPPTPPAHSRTSSSSHSVIPSSPTYVASPVRSTESIRRQPPMTPTNQRSPPTPNLTPEQSPPADRRPKPRPLISDRLSSKATTDSRTESFKTARENPYSSEEEDGKSTLRPILPSARSSHSTVRQTNGTTKDKSQTVGLGLGLESSPGDSLAPKTKGEFMTFDGDWGSGSEVEEQWDDNLMRTVTVRKRRTPVQPNGIKHEVIEGVKVTPTNATTLQESPVIHPARRVLSDQTKPSRAPTASDSLLDMDLRRLSGMSTKSTVSTVVEAILVDTPLQRPKTLRHVKKQNTLRQSATDLNPIASSPRSSPFDDLLKERLTSDHRGDARHESTLSTGTSNSISSRKARREVRKNGGIPVVVIPERRSSSKEPSLRSTSSKRSKRSQSLGSAPPSQISKSKDGAVPNFERPARRSRALSESDGSRSGDQRTIDYPPVIPTRSSSLSAPTSRNASRTGSLTTESLQAHNAIQAQRARKALQGLPTQGFGKAGDSKHQETRDPGQGAARCLPEENLFPAVTIQPAPSFESSPSDKGAHGLLPHFDHYGDPFFGRRLSVQKTPFSQASVETTGTFNAEVSEALAVNIYPHQNTSVLVVEHSNKPSESSSLEQKQKASEQENQEVLTSTVEAVGPVTPPQPAFSMDDVDSPLRNPRTPPEPPAIKFIPATPSGLTPDLEKEKQLGNYYEEIAQKPTLPISLLRRTLSRRRHSEYGPGAIRGPGILTRTFSLSRNVKKETADNLERSKAAEPMHPSPGGRPAEEDKLHPFWRPAHDDQSADEEDWVHDVRDEETYRYPLVDNRPRHPRRSLSSRLKRTFAILPLRTEYDNRYAVNEPGGTAHRLIRRTPSGALRVVKHRRSVESLRRSQTQDQRPHTSPDSSTNGPRRRPWRSNSLSRTLSTTMEKYGLHNSPRIISERQRQKRSQELRESISKPHEVRDGVGDVIKRNSYRETFYQAPHV